MDNWLDWHSDLQPFDPSRLYTFMAFEDYQFASDAEVVDLVRSGERGLYELLIRRYNQRLFRIIRSVVKNDLEAEDALQEAWVHAYEHLDQFAGLASFSTWVSRIAYHEALARSRKSKRWTPLEGPKGEIVREVTRCQTTLETPEIHVMRCQLRQTLEAAVDALPDAYRSVFMLREVEQLSTVETAECLGLSVEAVKTRLHRSRALLRRELQNRIGSAAAETHSFLGARCDRTVAKVLARIEATFSKLSRKAIVPHWP